MVSKSMATEIMEMDEVLYRRLRELITAELETNEELCSAIADYGLERDEVVRRAVDRRADLLPEAPKAYAAYHQAQQDVLSGGYRLAESGDDKHDDPDRAPPDQRARQLLRVGLRRLIPGAAVAIVGKVAETWWSPARVLWWVGIAMLVIAIVVTAIALLLRTSPGGLLLARVDLAMARTELVNAFRDHSDRLVPFLRSVTNDARLGRLGYEFQVGESIGLGEVHDPQFVVETATAKELEELIGSLSGGSIGVAGPRGTGKSTLVRGVGRDDPDRRVDLTCLVSAPVNYAARDFVLHLFAEFCRSTERWAQTIARTRPTSWQLARAITVTGLDLAAAGVLLVLAYQAPDWLTDQEMSRWVEANLGLEVSPQTVARGILVVLAAVFVLPALLGGLKELSARLVAWRKTARPGRRRLAKRARRNLRRIRYLQTHTTGWSGALPSSAEATAARRAQPHSPSSH